MTPESAVEARLFDRPEGRLKPDAVALRLAGALHALLPLGRMDFHGRWFHRA